MLTRYTFVGGLDVATGKFTFTLDRAPGASAIYGIQIVWEEDASVFQCSFPFKISGGGSGSAPGSGGVSSSTSGLVSAPRTTDPTAGPLTTTSSNPTLSLLQDASAGGNAGQSPAPSPSSLWRPWSWESYWVW